MNQPLVSVVITAYNLGWCIETTLRSVFEQTYPNIETIVVDDASVDDTQARLAPYRDRITYIRHATNQGVSQNTEAGPARNTGIAAATGDYIAILDGDDLWEPEKIAVQVEAAQRHPDAGMTVVDGIAFANEDGQTLRSTLLFDIETEFFGKLVEGQTLEADLYHQFLEGCIIDTPSQVMFPRWLFDKVGPYAVCRSEDYEIYLRASAAFKVVVVKRNLVRYRQHHANLSGKPATDAFRFVQPDLDIWKRHLRTCRSDARPILKRRIARTLRSAGDTALERGRQGDRAWARRTLWALMRNNATAPGISRVAYRFALLHCPSGLAAVLGELHERGRP